MAKNNTEGEYYVSKIMITLRIMINYVMCQLCVVFMSSSYNYYVTFFGFPVYEGLS